MARKQLTPDIIACFATAEDGTNLSRKFVPQRNYLRDAFEKKKGDMLEFLYSVSLLFQHLWDNAVPLPVNMPLGCSSDISSNRTPANELPDMLLENTAPNSSTAAESAAFSLKYLNSSKHRVCRALLARFLHTVRKSSQRDTRLYASHLHDAILATTALWCIWSSTRPVVASADGIPDWYIHMMSDDLLLCLRNDSREETLIPSEQFKSYHFLLAKHVSGPMSRDKSNNEALDLHMINSAFKCMLRLHDKESNTKVPDLTSFRNSLSKTYQNDDTAKFLLHIIYNDAEPDSNLNGTFKAATCHHPIISKEAWDSEKYVVGRIISANETDASGEHYTDSDLNRLGNLMLMPGKLAEYLKKLSAADCRVVFACLATEDEPTARKSLDEVANKRILKSLVKEWQEIRSEIRACDYAGLHGFEYDDISKRGSNLAVRAWSMLYEQWLHCKLWSPSTENSGANGMDLVSYFTDEQNPTTGSIEHIAKFAGANWRFKDEANLNLYKKDPIRYLPKYGGYCATSMSSGCLAVGNPEFWTKIDNSLYFFQDQPAQEAWQEQLVEHADIHWLRYVMRNISRGSIFGADGFDLVSYTSDDPNAPIKGDAEHTFSINGKKWKFCSKENLTSFASTPEVYLPQFGGCCALSISKGYLAYGDPRCYLRSGNELRFFADDEARSEWANNVSVISRTAEDHWKKFSKQIMLLESQDKNYLSALSNRYYERDYERILRKIDKNSSTEAELLQHLFENKLRLPDGAQKKVPDLGCKPDFFYEPDIHVFCDGSVHDKAEVKEKDAKQRKQIREQLEHTVLEWHYSVPVAEFIARHKDVFTPIDGI